MTKTYFATTAPNVDHLTPADGTHAHLVHLATDLARFGEDVHAAAAWRLARATVATDEWHLSTGEVLRRVRTMRAPQCIRPRIEQAAAAIAAVLAETGAVTDALTQIPLQSVDAQRRIV